MGTGGGAVPEPCRDGLAWSAWGGAEACEGRGRAGSAEQAGAVPGWPSLERGGAGQGREVGGALWWRGLGRRGCRAAAAAAGGRAGWLAGGPAVVWFLCCATG